MEPCIRRRKNLFRLYHASGIFRRFYDENMLQTSSALAFTTLLALVPMVTVLLSVAAAVPYFDVLLARLDFLVRETLLPIGAAGTIASSIGRFSQKARQLTGAGLAVLGVTAFLLLHTIERTFNHLWLVEPRPMIVRLRLYVFVIVVWPFLLGAVAGAVSFTVTVSLGLMEEPLWFRHFALKSVAVTLLGLFFSLLYFAVPNVRVPWRAALAGGVFAALAFSAMQKGFELFLASSAILSSVYGAFAVFPAFLVWLQLSWAVVLLGGLIAANATVRSAE